MAFAGNGLVLYIRNRRVRETVVDAHARRWEALGWTCIGIFLRLQFVVMQFACYSDAVENVRLMSDWLQKIIGTGTLDLACRCL